MFWEGRERSHFRLAFHVDQSRRLEFVVLGTNGSSHRAILVNGSNNWRCDGVTLRMSGSWMDGDEFSKMSHSQNAMETMCQGI